MVGPYSHPGLEGMIDAGMLAMLLTDLVLLAQWLPA